MNKKVLVICNLKPATLRGIVSNGMLLAAEKEGTIELVEAPEDALVGSKVTVEGLIYSNSSAIIDRSKKDGEKAFEVLKDLATNIDCIATYKERHLTTSKGPCRVKSLAKALIR